MALAIPDSTQAVIAAIEAELKPAEVDELSQTLAGLHLAEGLSDAERKGAWAEASAFNFMESSDSPWGTHYGPVIRGTNPDGSPYYGPDLREIDEEIITHWEQRS
jgi:hypothetical protein